jgi:hypothetical protein
MSKKTIKAKIKRLHKHAVTFRKLAEILTERSAKTDTPRTCTGGMIRIWDHRGGIPKWWLPLVDQLDQEIKEGKF